MNLGLDTIVEMLAEEYDEAVEKLSAEDALTVAQGLRSALAARIAGLEDDIRNA